MATVERQSSHFSCIYAETDVPWEIYFPDGAVRRFGQATPDFSVMLKNRNAAHAITSLDQVKFAEATLVGDINGDMLRPFALRQSSLPFTSHYEIDP